jgi:hypothetical protein
VYLVPYSRKPVIKNKKSGEYVKIRMLKITSKALIPYRAWGLKRVPLEGC